MGDEDGDGDRDLDDFETYLGCTTGPSDEHASPLAKGRHRRVGDGDPDCAFFDFNLDTDIDFADLAEFQIRFTGP
jgi:hypothetical protein